MTVRAHRTAYWASVCCAGSAALAAEPSVTRAHAAPVTRSTSLPVATDVRLGGDDKQTRFVVDLTPEDRSSRAFTLADPYRVVIDLPQVTFKLPAQAGEQGRGLVKAFRYGLIMQGGSRIVLDTKGPVRVDKAFVLAAADGQPARLVLDLAATDRDSFLRNIAHAEPQPRTPPPSQRSAGAGSDRRSAAADRARSRPWRHRQRHQVAASGRTEKDIVLAFAPDAARQAREDRQIPRGDDAHRRHLHSARRAGALRARAQGRRCSSRSMPMRSRAAKGRREGATVYTLSDPPPTPRRRGWPKPKTRPT